MKQTHLDFNLSEPVEFGLVGILQKTQRIEESKLL